MYERTCSEPSRPPLTKFNHDARFPPTKVKLGWGKRPGTRLKEPVGLFMENGYTSQLKPPGAPFHVLPLHADTSPLFISPQHPCILQQPIPIFGDPTWFCALLPTPHSLLRGIIYLTGTTVSSVWLYVCYCRSHPRRRLARAERREGGEMINNRLHAKRYRGVWCGIKGIAAHLSQRK